MAEPSPLETDVVVTCKFVTKLPAELRVPETPIVRLGVLSIYVLLRQAHACWNADLPLSLCPCLAGGAR